MEEPLSERIEAAFEKYAELVRLGSSPDIHVYLGSLAPDIREEVRQLVLDFHELRDEFSEASLDLRAGAVIGDFRLVKKLGRGATAVVWQARQNSLDRDVALKVLLPIYQLSSDPIEKFHREARAGGRLVHPGIAQTYFVSSIGSCVFIVQELIPEGRTLARRILKKRYARELPADYFLATASLFADIASALQFAHDCKVIHRDVKPGNILLTPEGAPKVADFGLAKIDAELGLSRTGDLQGTPYYMSPEQVTAKRIGLDSRTDIFSLGATLYECLTFSRAFDGDNSHQIYQKILYEDPKPPRELRSRIPRDLEVICMKALQKSVKHRYQTMSAFEADLRSMLSHKPISARPLGSIARMQRWSLRHPLMAISGVLSAILFLSVLYHVIKTDITNSYILWKSYLSHMHAAELELAHGDISEAMRLLEECPEKHRRWEWEHLYLKTSQGKLVGRHDSAIEAASVCHSGRYMVTGSRSGRVKVFDLHSQSERAAIAIEPGPISAVAMDVNERYVLIGTASGGVWAWDFASKTHAEFMGKHSTPVIRTLVGTVGRGVLSASSDGMLILWNLERRTKLRELPEAERMEIYDVAMGMDEQIAALCTSEGLVRLWHLDTGQVVDAERRHRAAVNHAVFNRACNRLLTASEDNDLRVWEIPGGKFLGTLKGHRAEVMECAFDPSGGLAIGGDLRGEILVWDVRDIDESKDVVQVKQPGMRMRHEDRITKMAISGDGRFLASGSADSSVRIWDLESFDLAGEVTRHDQGIRLVQFSSDGSTIHTASRDGTVRNQQLATRTESHIADVSALVLNSDRSRLYTGSVFGGIHAWDPVSGIEYEAWDPYPSMVVKLELRPSEGELISVHLDGMIRICDLETGAIKGAFKTDYGPIYRAAIHADRGLIGLANGRGVAIWSLATRSIATRLPEHNHWAMSIAFHPNGEQVLTGSGNGALRVWSVGSGNMLQEREFEDAVDVICMDRKGEMLLIGSRDKSVALLDADRLETERVFYRGRFPVTALAFGPGGERVVSGTTEGTISMWDLQSGEKIVSMKSAQSAGTRPGVSIPRKIFDIQFSPDGSRLYSLSGDSIPRALTGSVMTMWESDQKTAEIASSGASLRTAAEAMWLSEIVSRISGESPSAESESWGMGSRRITESMSDNRLEVSADELNRRAWNISFGMSHDYEFALSLIGAAITIDSMNPYYWRTRAWIECRLKQYESAIHSLDQSREIRSKSALWKDYSQEWDDLIRTIPETYFDRRQRIDDAQALSSANARSWNDHYRLLLKEVNNELMALGQ